MSERIVITTAVAFEAFDVPDRVCVLPDENDEEADGFCAMGMAFVDASVIDRLAARWLSALYAQRGEASPFTLQRDHLRAV